MKDFLKTLKKEHNLIVKILEKIKKFDLTKKERIKLFNNAENFLKAHIDKEDKYLYPVLMKEAEKDENLKLILDTFASDMKTISAEVKHFFETHKNKELDNSFYSDLGHICAKLSERILKEEEILFKKYEELIKDGK